MLFFRSLFLCLAIVVGAILFPVLVLTSLAAKLYSAGVRYSVRVINYSIFSKIELADCCLGLPGVVPELPEGSKWPGVYEHSGQIE